MAAARQVMKLKQANYNQAGCAHTAFSAFSSKPCSVTPTLKLLFTLKN